MKFSRRQFGRVAGSGLASLAIGPLAIIAQEQKAPPTPRVLLTWGSNGHGDGQFDIPIGITVNRLDEILVTDFRQTNGKTEGRLQRFDPGGRFLSSFVTEPMPGGLAIDKEGLLYATHMMRHKVVVYDMTGRQVREFGRQGSGPGEFEQPGGIAFGPDGSVYVADQVNHRVQRLTSRGEPIAAWGKYGVATGEFGGNSSEKSRGGGPHFLAFDSRANIYTTEGSVGRIQKFKGDGTFVLAWGDNETGPGHFGGGNASLKGPIAIAINAKDEIWVSSTNHWVQQFTSDGQYVRGIGGEGSAKGEFRLPHGLAFDSRGHLYVADARNSRIQKLAV